MHRRWAPTAGASAGKLDTSIYSRASHRLSGEHYAPVRPQRPGLGTLQRSQWQRLAYKGVRSALTQRAVAPLAVARHDRALGARGEPPPHRPPLVLIGHAAFLTPY